MKSFPNIDVKSMHIMSWNIRMPKVTYFITASPKVPVDSNSFWYTYTKLYLSARYLRAKKTNPKKLMRGTETEKM